MSSFRRLPILLLYIKLWGKYFPTRIRVFLALIERLRTLPSH